MMMCYLIRKMRRKIDHHRLRSSITMTIFRLFHRPQQLLCPSHYPPNQVLRQAQSLDHPPKPRAKGKRKLLFLALLVYSIQMIRLPKRTKTGPSLLAHSQGRRLKIGLLPAIILLCLRDRTPPKCQMRPPLPQSFSKNHRPQSSLLQIQSQNLSFGGLKNSQRFHYSLRFPRQSTQFQAR
ncbi:hypothetical protein DL96DRAFT_1441 [Flagelloscypha sp. PMI_526]|nr:hypothetical protein DL96DRAFT_1441 [Flagelloscypha sp. PMI_526]